MSAFLERPGDNLWLLRVRGVLKKSELDTIQSRLADRLEPEEADVRLLVLLEAFEGWERGAAWNDAEFFFTHGDRISRIAFVGDPRWEMDAMTFVGTGIRKAPVRFFPPMAEAEARAWVQS